MTYLSAIHHTNHKKSPQSYFLYALFLFFNLILNLSLWSGLAYAATVEGTCLGYGGQSKCESPVKPVTGTWNYLVVAGQWGDIWGSGSSPSTAAAAATAYAHANPPLIAGPTPPYDCANCNFMGNGSSSSPYLGMSASDFYDSSTATYSTANFVSFLPQSQRIPISQSGVWAASISMSGSRTVTPFSCPAGTTQLSFQNPTPTRYPFMCQLPPEPKRCNCNVKNNPLPNGVGNPIDYVAGNKNQTERDWSASLGVLSVSRTYYSLPENPNIVGFNRFPAGSTGIPATNAGNWEFNFNQRIYVQFSQLSGGNLSQSNNGSAAPLFTIPSSPDHSWQGNPNAFYPVIKIKRAGDNTQTGYFDHTTTDTNGNLTKITFTLDQSGTGITVDALPDGTWSYQNSISGITETYNANGQMTQWRKRNGQFINYAYTNATDVNPSTITDNFGQTLQLTLDSSGRVTQITLPTGKSITYSYTSTGQIANVLRPGFGVKTYVYDSTTPNLLTGIIDEKGNRFATFTYDQNGLAISTEHAGGTNKYTVNYSTVGQRLVTDPRGGITTYGYQLEQGYNVASASTDNTTNATTSLSFDSRGNVTSSSKNGQTTTYTYDPVLNLETSRTEAVGTPQQRTITTQYNPVLPLPVLITEQGKTTAYTYDGNGNVLTKTITDTTASPNVSRVWTYTYNTVGQKLSETNPAGETTSYSYDNYGHLLTVTDALGHVTTYGSYNALGQPTTITTPTGSVTTYTYDDAGRVLTSAVVVSTDGYPDPATVTQNHGLSAQIIKFLKWLLGLFDLPNPFPIGNMGAVTLSVSATPLPSSTTTRTETTSYSYDPIGQLTQVQMPNGATLTYNYDAAHRLIAATDSLGNSISYTLNGAGDITQTNSQDPTGQIKLQTKQVFDTLGRVQQDLGNNGQNTTYSYDNFNNLTGTADALSRQTSSSYDPLNRKITDLDALGGKTQYSYNALDQLLTVTDSRNNTTSYQPNAFGENTIETSPDTGVTTRTYSNGRLATVVDSNNITHTYSYDNLGRVITRVDGTGTGQLTTTYGYDAGTYGQGYLTSITNSVIGVNNVSSTISTTTYVRDSLGNVTQKSLNVPGGQASLNQYLPVQYQYLTGNNLSDIMLPSGHRITYHYTAGKITSVTSGTDTLISNIQYGPTGIVSWTWGTGSDTNIFSTDNDGRITGVTSTGVLGRNYTYDAGNRIATIADTAAGIGTQSYTHDSLDRLTQQTLNNLTLGYSYDANSNRTGKVQNTQGTTTQTTYAIQSSTNRIDTTTTGSSTALTSTYLPTGQLVSDGVRVYSYDSAGRSATIRNGSNTIANLYDGLGQRINKNTGTAATTFIYDESGHLLGEYDQNNAMVREYIWLGDRVIGMYSKDVPNVLLRVHTDHLGTPRAVSQGDGVSKQVLWRFEGDAFGDIYPTNPTTTALTMPLRMAGQYYDVEVGTSYNYFRDYQPDSGRYVESDPIGLDGGNNTYGYVGGSPLKAVDPMGLDFAIPSPNSINWPKITLLCMAGGKGLLGFATTATDASPSCDSPQAPPQECPSDKPCDPPEGTLCYGKLNNTHPHGKEPNILGDHYHIFQMQRKRSEPGKPCFWARLVGKVNKGVFETPPIGMRPCSSYPGGSDLE
ncbi:MAG: RHS repeat protein [Gammaproteobacteria bacterium]|nr:RHS repeat protein [Gammaproteobacteria bacterium]